MPQKGTKLTKMRITHISLVRNPANREEVVWKSAEGEQTAPPGYEAVGVTVSRLAKSDERRMVYGLVYCPGVVDAQGEYAEGAEISDAAYGFMKELRGNNVDVQHDFSPRGAYVAESWLTKGRDALFPDAPEGSWAVGIRVDDEVIWKSVKDGELKGLSMAGFAQRVRKEDGFLKGMDSFFEAMASLLKGKTEDMQKSGTKDTDSKDGGTPPAELDAEKFSAAMEAMSGLPDWMEKMDTRLDVLEKSTPGLKSGTVDGVNRIGEVGGIL